MIPIIAAQIFIQAAVLCAILYVVAKHEADYSFGKVAMVTAAIGVGSFIIEAMAWEKLGWFTVIPVLAFTAAMLMTFCWITLWKAITVIIVFTGFHLLLNIGVAKIQYKMQEAVQESVLVTGPVDKSDYELAKEFTEQVGATLSGERPKVNQPATPEPAQPEQEQPEPTKEPTDDKQDEPGPEKKSLRDWARKLQPELTPVPGTENKEPDPKQEAPTTSDLWQEAEAKLIVGGKIRDADGSYVAYVNRKLVETGDMVSLVHKNTLYRWRVKVISKDTVEFQPLDAKPTR